MTVAADSVAANATSLRRKSRMAIPFFHPALGWGVALVVTAVAAMRGAFPLASAFVSRTSIIVELLLLILGCGICFRACVRGRNLGDNSEPVMKMAGWQVEPRINRNQRRELVETVGLWSGNRGGAVGGATLKVKSTKTYVINLTKGMFVRQGFRSWIR